MATGDYWPVDRSEALSRLDTGTAVIALTNENLVAFLERLCVDLRTARETLTACQAENTRLVLENRTLREQAIK